MSDPLDLAPIRARLEAATPGPWSEAGSVPRAIVAAHNADINLLSLYTFGDGDGPYAVVASQDDAALIAHAPTDIAALLAEVERLQALVVGSVVVPVLPVDLAVDALVDAIMAAKTKREARAAAGPIWQCKRCDRWYSLSDNARWHVDSTGHTMVADAGADDEHLSPLLPRVSG